MTEPVLAADASTAPVLPSVASEKAIILTPPDDSDTLAYMGKVLPHMRASLATTRRVSPSEFDSAIATLGDQEQAAFTGLIARMNPNTEFMDSNQEGIVLNMLKIDQGAGDDPARPENSTKGAVYSKPAGQLVTTMPAFQKMTGLPTKLKVFVLASYNGRMFFAPKDAQGKPVPPAGVTLHGNAPICVSHDRKVGAYFDECRVCPYRPFASGSLDRGGCKDHVDLYVCTADLSNLFRISVGATSFKTCTNLIQQKLVGLKPWERAFFLSTEKVTRPNQEYYVWKAVLDTEGEGNANGAPTPEHLLPLLELFARQIRTELHLPALASTYARAKEKTGPSDGPVAVAADTASVMAAAESMDYSSEGSGNV